MRIKVEIPNSDIGRFEIDGDFATEDSLKKLLDALEVRNDQNRINTNDIQDNLDDASDNLDEFSDELDRAEKSQRKLTKRIEEFGSKTLDGAQSMSRAAESGMDFSDVVRTVGDVAAGAADGLASIVPIVGPAIGKLAGGAIQAGSALAAMAISSAESFIGLNKSIFNAGLQVDGGFGAFAEFATDARIPVNEFANAMMQSSDRLRLFASGAPGGIGQISSALTRMVDDDTMENLYGLGFTTEEVVAGMADFAIAAQRQGKNLSTAELAEGAEDYLKNLRELSRLSGEDVKSIQARIEADRANLFVQNQLNKLNSSQSTAVQKYIASLSDSDRMMADYLLTGQSQTATSGILVEQNRAYADTLRSTIQTIISSNGDLDLALAQEKKLLQENANVIDAQTRQYTNMFGVTMEDITGFGATLGESAVSVRERVAAAFGTEAAGGGDDAEGLSETLGSLEYNINQVNAAIQDTLIDTLEASSGLINRVTNVIGDSATKVNDFREAIGGMLSGNFERFNTMLGTSAEAGDSMWENLENAVTAAIERGIKNAFGGTLLGSLFGVDKEPSEGSRSRRLQRQENRQLEQGENQRLDVIEQRNKTVTLDDPDLLLAREANYSKAAFMDSMPENITDDKLSSVDTEIQRLQHTLDSLVEQQSGFSRRERRSDEYKTLIDEIQTAKQQIENLKTQKNNDGFRDGGIASGPDSGYETTLHGTEAVVPLPGDRAIPVNISTAGDLKLPEQATYRDFDSVMQELSKEKNIDFSQVTDVLTDLIEQISLLNSQTSVNSEKQTQQNQKTDALISLIRNVLDQSMSSNQKMEKFVKAMEESNFINNRNGFSRA